MGKKFFSNKKSRSAEKNERGESLVSPGMVCYAEKPFWFSSLDQIVHFDAIIFCRTFVELFWSVRVDRKKRVTIIVAFHFMKRRLKIAKKSPTKPKNLHKKFLVMGGTRKAPTKKGAGKSHGVEKLERGTSCFAMVLYFMFEDLDAFKIKYKMKVQCTKSATYMVSSLV